MAMFDTLEVDIQQIRERIAQIDAHPLPPDARTRHGETPRTREYWEQLLAQREAELERQQKAAREAAEREEKRKAKARAAAEARAPEIAGAAHNAAQQWRDNMGAADALIAATPFANAVAAWDEYHRLHRAYELLRMDAPELPELPMPEAPPLQFAALLAAMLEIVRPPVGGAHRPRLRLM